jgi:hypothetical protein
MLALAFSGWASWAANQSTVPPVAAAAAVECKTELELKTEPCRLAALELRVTASEQLALAHREQTALVLQAIVGVIVQGAARGNQAQRDAMAAAAQRRFKRALVQGSTFEQALKEAIGGGDD